MDIVFYLLALVGSFSLGYGILRTGFPRMQEAGKIKKIGYGYGLGAIVFVPGIVAASTFGDKGFFLVSGVVFACLFGVMLVKRVAGKEKDASPLVKEEKTKIELPRKVLTDEEKSGNEVGVVSADKTREQIFKEKEPSVIAAVKKDTLKMEQKRIDKEKEEALKKLRSFAREIKTGGPQEGSKKKVADDELEEMAEFGDEQ